MAKICPKCGTRVSGQLASHCATCQYTDGSPVPLISEEQYAALEKARQKHKMLDSEAFLASDSDKSAMKHASG